MNINLDSSQAKTLVELMEYDFTRFYETLHYMIDEKDYGSVVYFLNTLDTILAVLESLGARTSGGYYDDLDKLVGKIPGELFSKSTLYDRYFDSDT